MRQQWPHRCQVIFYCFSIFCHTSTVLMKNIWFWFMGSVDQVIFLNLASLHPHTYSNGQIVLGNSWSRCLFGYYFLCSFLFVSLEKCNIRLKNTNYDKHRIFFTHFEISVCRFDSAAYNVPSRQFHKSFFGPLWLI